MAVAEKVKKMIVEQLGVSEAEVVPEAKFIDDLGADSLDIVELVMALEDEYGIEIGAGLGPLRGKVWRIGLMGHGSQKANVILLLAALVDILRRP